MNAETQAHIFSLSSRPSSRKGTGLGLSTVYGVVKQSGGFIWVYSEVGRGLLSRFISASRPAGREHCIAPTVSEAPRGTETILLAEDEQDVREVAREFLESEEYTVIEARDGAEALKRWRNTKTPSTCWYRHGHARNDRTGTEHATLQVARRFAFYICLVTANERLDSARGDSSCVLLSKPFSRWALLAPFTKS